MRELVCNGQLWAKVAQPVGARSDSESIFQQQFGEYHGDDVCYSIDFAAAQSLGSQDYHKNPRMRILGLAGILFCEDEQAQTKWIIVCSEENTYLDAKGS